MTRAVVLALAFGVLATAAFAGTTTRGKGAVPEPVSMAVLGLGFGGMLLKRRQK
jgi:hypothetical protein